ncbi:low temperature requirement protein LtrA [Chitinophaga niastensis]|uniref:Low temperature requirement protein LtrA n=1 Tax=Chitinophaga niastensis TaxID=536980 RepID=A0A2P8HGH9_CHINA|nr:low temperature requirement protein A [Chitinophaga niastensis]PSL45331.1 low temperature requirement protein LtrA [Chitinophaga niastensis]
MSRHTTSIWWGAPKKFFNWQSERKISWLELFFDLVYVGAIAQLTEHLSKEPNWMGGLNFFFFFLFIFWSWTDGSLYHDIHGSEGVRTRSFTLLQMMAVSAVAINFHDVFEGNHRGLAISLSLIQLIIHYLWWSVGYWEPEHRRLNTYYRITYPISAVLLIISVFTDFPTAKILWGLALVCNYSASLLSGLILGSHNKNIPVFTLSDSMVERFGLFTIIVLCEALTGIVRGMSVIQHKSLIVWTLFVLSMLIVFLLWWIYFDMLGDRKIKPGYSPYLSFIYLNIPLQASIAAMGALISIVLSDTDGQNGEVRQLFLVAIAIILLSIMALSLVNKWEKEAANILKSLLRFMLLAVVGILGIATISSYISTIVFLGLIAAILLVIVVVITRIWFKHKLFKEATKRIV